MTAFNELVHVRIPAREGGGAGVYFSLPVIVRAGGWAGAAAQKERACQTLWAQGTI